MKTTKIMAWRDERNADLMRRLIDAQNHPANIDRDVMTIAGFMDTREQLQAHVEACEAARRRRR